MSIITANVAQIKFGTIEIEGLMFSDGSFGVAIPQLEKLNLVPPNRSLKQLESLLGLGFPTHQKVKTTLNSKAVNTINLIDFEKVLRSLDRKGNKLAQELRDSLVGLSLTQLFSDSFGVKFEADDRQKYLETRMAGKVTRSTLTDSIDSYVQTHAVSVNYGHWIYSNVSDCLNLGLFGKKASKLCIERGCNKNELRDTHDEVTLARIDKIEAVAMIQIDNGMEPIEAMKFTLSTVFRIAC